MYCDYAYTWTKIQDILASAAQILIILVSVCFSQVPQRYQSEILNDSSVPLRYNSHYVTLTAPASVPVPVGISSNTAGSRPPGASFPPHPVLKSPSRENKHVRHTFNK